MLVLGTALAIPMSLLAAFAPSDEVLFVARVGGGVSRRHGVSDDARADHCALVRSGPHEVDRPLVCARRRDRRSRPAGRRRAARGVRLGLGLPRDAAAGRCRARAGVPLRAEPRERDVRSRRQPRRDPLRRCSSARSSSAINFAPVPNEGALVARPRGHRARGARRLLIRQRRAANPLYDLHVASRRIFWVAACAGIIVFGSLMGGCVHQPAVPAERPRLLDARGRGRDPPGGARAWSSSRRGRPSSSRRAAPGSRCSAATSSCSSRSPRCCSSGTKARRTGRSALAYVFIGAGVGLAGDPRIALAHRLGARVTRAGMASGTADLQRDLGGAIMQSIFGALLTAGYASAMSAAIAASGQDVTDCTQSAAHEVVRRRRGHCGAAPAVRGRDHRGGEERRSSTGTTGRTPPGSSPSSWGGPRLLHVPASTTRKSACLPSTTRRTPALARLETMSAPWSRARCRRELQRDADRRHGAAFDATRAARTWQGGARRGPSLGPR